MNPIEKPWIRWIFITAYFDYINRVADGLDVPPETFMTPWSREDGDW